MNWKSIIIAVSKWPVAQYLKPIWKKGLIWGVTAAGETLRADAKAEAQKDAKKLLARLEPLLTNWKDWIKGHVADSWIPDQLEGQILQAVDTAWAQLQQGFAVAADVGSSAAVSDFIDREIDKAEAFLTDRINAL